MKFLVFVLIVAAAPFSAFANRSFENVERVIQCRDSKFDRYFTGIKYKTIKEPFCDPTNRRLIEIRNGHCVFVKDTKCGTANFFVDEEPNPEFNVQDMVF